MSSVSKMELAAISSFFDSKTSSAVAAAAACGIASSLYFRRHETTITGFTLILTVLTVFARVATAGTWDARQIVEQPILPVVAIVTAFLGGLGGSILHYRLISTTHPLHDIPGPVLARTTKWWLYRCVVGGNIRSDFSKVHAKYGKVVRIAPNEISIADAAAILPVHGAKSWIRGTSYHATAYSKNGEATANASMLNLIDHASHTPRRRIWDKAFTISSLRDYEPMVLNRIGQLCREFDAREGKTLDLNEWMGYLVFDVTSDLAYGGGTSFLEQGKDDDGIVHGVLAALRLQGRTMAIPWLSGITAYSQTARKMVPFMRYAGDRFLKRIEEGNPTGGKDFIYHLNNEGDEKGSELTMTAMGSDAALIMAAGADTTRLAISICFMYMLRKPELYKKLRDAVDDALTGKETTTVNGLELPAHDLLKNLPLLDAYIDETLRIHPPLSIEPMREAPVGGIMVAGTFIPGGSQVRVPSHIIHTDPANFDSPREFRPERWLKDANNKAFNKGAFFPFLFGPFHCVGKQFAYQEMRLFIATILWKYDVAFGPGFNSYSWERNITDNGTLLDIHEPLQVVLTHRKK